MEIQGYLEAGGLVTKVSSIEDIKNFIARCGRSINEMTEAELDKMVCYEKRLLKCLGGYKDDCNVVYKKTPLICLNGDSVISNHMSSYKILNETIAINMWAFSASDFIDRLQFVYMPDTVVVIGDHAFEGRGALNYIQLSKALLKIGNDAFSECISLKILSHLPVLKYIGARAFKSSGLETITIPASTINIGSCAFCNCQRLTSVTFEGVPSNIGSDIFDGCVSLMNVYVPHGSFDYFVKALYPLDKAIIKKM